jgi:hypothetical protein
MPEQPLMRVKCCLKCFITIFRQFFVTLILAMNCFLCYINIFWIILSRYLIQFKHILLKSINKDWDTGKAYIYPGISWSYGILIIWNMCILLTVTVVIVVEILSKFSFPCWSSAVYLLELCAWWSQEKRHGKCHRRWVKIYLVSMIGNYVLPFTIMLFSFKQSQQIVDRLLHFKRLRRNFTGQDTDD